MSTPPVPLFVREAAAHLLPWAARGAVCGSGSLSTIEAVHYLRDLGFLRRKPETLSLWEITEAGLVHLEIKAAERELEAMNERSVAFGYPSDERIK